MHANKPTVFCLVMNTSDLHPPAVFPHRCPITSSLHHIKHPFHQCHITILPHDITPLFVVSSQLSCYIITSPIPSPQHHHHDITTYFKSNNEVRCAKYHSTVMGFRQTQPKVNILALLVWVIVCLGQHLHYFHHPMSMYRNKI